MEPGVYKKTEKVERLFNRQTLKQMSGAIEEIASVSKEAAAGVQEIAASTEQQIIPWMQ